MDLMKVIGTVLAVFWHPGCALLKGFASQRICRGGTEKPCYKIVSHQDSAFRVNFEEARRSCKEDNGDLLSIESESEQRLVEKFVQGSQVADGDLWIGLRRKQFYKESDAKKCFLQYYWLDYIQAMYRNWLLHEPSCGSEHCVALYHRSRSAASKDANKFKWTDTNCNSKNNFICKYSEEKYHIPTLAGNSSTNADVAAVTFKPKLLPVTLDNEKIKEGFSDSSVSFSGDSINVSYILMATVPVLLLLILAVSVVLCYRLMAKKRKEPNDIYAVPGQWMSSTASKTGRDRTANDPLNPCVTHLEYMSSDISRTCSATASPCQSVEYENVPSSTAGFVTNDIYETCRTVAGLEAGWVDNDIYA